MATSAVAELPATMTVGELALTVIGPGTETVVDALRSPAPLLPAEVSRTVRLPTSPSADSGVVTRKYRVVACPGASDRTGVPAGGTTVHPDGAPNRTVPSVIGRFPWLTNWAFAVNVA